MLYSRKVSRFFAMFFLACAMVFSYAPSVSALGTVSGEWVNAATIKLNSVTITQADRDNGDIDEDLDDLSIAQINSYIAQQVVGNFRDSNVGDGTHEWLRGNNGCDSKIVGGNSYELQNIKIQVAGIGCKDVIDGKDITLSQSNLTNQSFPGGGNRAQIEFTWINENTLERVDGREGPFVRIDANQPNRFFRTEENGEGDQDYVGSGPTDFTRGLYNVDGSTRNVMLTGLENRANPPTDINADPNANPADAQEPSCESEGGEMSWIICPLLRQADNFVSFVDAQINNLLQIPNGYFEGAAGASLEATWARLRNIAYLILVPILLVMVISTALGFDFISAYTIKKSLPRLVAATIFIALSYEVTKFLIVATNVVGKGILGLMVSAFTGGGEITLASLFDGGGIASNAIFTGMVLAGAAGGAVIAIAAFGLIASYALITIVALLIGFLTLALRQMILIALTLLAPLAILAWIFPGNDKLWKLWWGSFSKLLMMYPLIMIIIGGGRIFANVVQEVTVSGGDPAITGIMATVLKLTAYIAPYFFIPATFKFAGGLFATLAGAANDRSRGLFDRQKKYRQARGAQFKSDFKAGSLGNGFVGSKTLMRGANRVGRHAGAGFRGRLGFGEVGQVAMSNAVSAEPDEIAKSNPAFARRMVDETTMAALGFGGDRAKLAQFRAFQNDDGTANEAKITEAVAAAKTIGITRQNQIAASKQLARSGKVIENNDQAMDLIRTASGGHAATAGDLKGSLQYTWRGVGRNDIGRDNIADSFQEMSVNEVSKLKPLGAEGMFGRADATPEEQTAHIQKLQQVFTGDKLSADEKVHALAILNAGTSSPYLNPKQQAAAQTARDLVESLPGVWRPGDTETARRRGRESASDREYGPAAPPPEDN